MYATATSASRTASQAASRRIPGIVPHGYDFYFDPALFPQARVAAAAAPAAPAIVPSCSHPMPVSEVDVVPRTYPTIRNPAALERRHEEIITEKHRRSRAA